MGNEEKVLLNFFLAKKVFFSISKEKYEETLCVKPSEDSLLAEPCFHL